MQRFALTRVLAATLATPVLAVGNSDRYGRGGSFGDYDPIIDKYNRSGELFVIRDRRQSASTLFPEHPTARASPPTPASAFAPANPCGRRGAC